MRRPNFIFDETKLNLTFDENGDAVWSFAAVKEGVKCEKVLIQKQKYKNRQNVRNSFTQNKTPVFSITRRIAYAFMPRRIKNVLIEGLTRNIFKEPQNKSRYHIRYHDIVQGFAKEGLLEGHFNRKVIKLAKLFGFKPRNFNLHHNTPVVWGGTNDPENITLIQYNLHERLHGLTTDLVVKASKENKSKLSSRVQYVLMPVLPRVLTKKNIGNYFNGFEDLIKSQKERDAENFSDQKDNQHQQFDTPPKDNHKTLPAPTPYDENKQERQTPLKNRLQSLSESAQDKTGTPKEKRGKRRHKIANETWYGKVFKHTR